MKIGTRGSKVQKKLVGPLVPFFNFYFLFRASELMYKLWTPEIIFIAKWKFKSLNQSQTLSDITKNIYKAVVQICQKTIVCPQNTLFS